MSSSAPECTFTSTVLYLRSSDFTFNLDYYLSHHIPLCLKYWKPHGLIEARVVEADADQQYAYIVTMMWKDKAAWAKAKAQDEEIADIMGDVKEFTNAEPLFVVGQVVW
jgi:hypothetical protein